MNKLISQLLIAASLVFVFSFQVFADIVVVVNPTNDTTLTNKEIKRIFLNKAKKFPNGATATPVNQATDTDITSHFNKEILKKSDHQLKAYWSKLIFTGKGKPPQEAADDTAVKSLLANDPSIIGYIDSSAVDSSVKVIATF